MLHCALSYIPLNSPRVGRGPKGRDICKTCSGRAWLKRQALPGLVETCIARPADRFREQAGKIGGRGGYHRREFDQDDIAEVGCAEDDRADVSANRSANRVVGTMSRRL